jgi:hypothetical protein
MSAADFVALPLVLLLGVLGVAKVLAVPAMRTAAAHAQLSVATYRFIGIAEVAAVVGLVTGMWWAPAGASAAIGVVLLLAGAVAVHARNRDAFARLLPAVVTAVLAASYLVLLFGGQA